MHDVARSITEAWKAFAAMPINNLIEISTFLRKKLYEYGKANLVRRACGQQMNQPSVTKSAAMASKLLVRTGLRHPRTPDMLLDADRDEGCLQFSMAVRKAALVRRMSIEQAMAYPMTRRDQASMSEAQTPSTRVQHRTPDLLVIDDHALVAESRSNSMLRARCFPRAFILRKPARRGHAQSRSSPYNRINTDIGLL